MWYKEGGGKEERGVWGMEIERWDLWSLGYWFRGGWIDWFYLADGFDDGGENGVWIKVGRWVVRIEEPFFTKWLFPMRDRWFWRSDVDGVRKSLNYSILLMRRQNAEKAEERRKEEAGRSRWSLIGTVKVKTVDTRGGGY